jgi:tRNA modification GTPase
MTKNSSQDTIYALATAPGRAGVAVIRISGSKTEEVTKTLIGSDLPKPRFAHFTKYYAPQSEQLIDEGLLLWMPGPNSFTGEDVAEFQIHGGAAIIEAFFDSFSHFPYCRMAEPGEFSRRAFLNGKMDLTEIEAVADLVEAQTQHQHKLALRQMQGELGNLYRDWHLRLKKALAYMEAFLDFPDEDLPEEINPEIYKTVNVLKDEMTMHLEDHSIGERIREGFYISIVGLPNAGKSSLLNMLAQREVAIVTDLAGTTRDVLEVDLNLDGYPVILVDTAGLRETDDMIENIGVQRALQKAGASDLKIIMVEAAPLDAFRKDLSDLEKQIPLDPMALWVINKSDLVDTNTYEELKSALPGEDPLILSIKNNKGISDFKNALVGLMKTKYSIPDSPMLTRQRHRKHIEAALQSLLAFPNAKAQELAAEELRSAMYQVGCITGHVDVEDLLDVIFRDFCIGK